MDQPIECQHFTSGELTTGESQRDVINLMYSAISKLNYVHIMRNSTKPLSLYRQCVRSIAEAIMYNAETHYVSPNCEIYQCSCRTDTVDNLIQIYISGLNVPSSVKEDIIYEIEYVNAEHFRIYIEPTISYTYPNEY